MSERKEGWGSLTNAGKAHYFNLDGRSLCNRWASFSPRWETNQELGKDWSRDDGTCQTCWHKRARIERAGAAAVPGETP